MAVGATAVLAALYAITFGWLAVFRHLAGGSHAEDLGFTDQVLFNFLHGQWFRMSIYAQDPGTSWNTELDLSRIARPDSLLAFHAEPMLLLFVPIYAVGGGVLALLILQAVALAAGAIPAYRLGRYGAGSPLAGFAVAAAYLLSPLGQWAALSDFHTSTLAAPLLLLTIERLVVARAPVQAILVAGLAATAREDVGPVLAVLGALVLLHPRMRRTGAVMCALGAGWTILAALVIRTYSGGISPFEVRYGPTLGTGLEASLAALARPSVVAYVQTLLLSGGWLGVLAPWSLLPALPELAINTLSTSPWMAAGKAHYSGLVLPFVTASAAAGLYAITRRLRRLRALAGGALVLTSLVGYLLEGAGPLGANYAPAVLTSHATRAEQIAASLPPAAAVSASSGLVPHVTRRPHVYVFPTVLDADYVFVDLTGSPAPTSAGDVYLHIQDLLGSGDWQIESQDDGLLLLHRQQGSPVTMAERVVPAMPTADASHPTAAVDVSLVSAVLVRPPDGAIDVDGPRWILRTQWRPNQPLPRGTRLAFSINLEDGEQLYNWDIADLWWTPPDQWTPGAVVSVDVLDVPKRKFDSWQATWSTP